MTDPLVTVLMPVRNGAAYLREAIDSVLQQTFREFELLIIDDASEDESHEIINSYRDPRIRCLRNVKRLKLAGALNRGIDQARGRLIARMDADDICLPHRLESQVQFMQRRPEISLCGSSVDSFGDGALGRWEYPAWHNEIYAELLFDNPFAHPSMMIKRDCFAYGSNRYNVEYYPAEDYALWQKLVGQYKSANLRQSLLRYRLQPKSMTRSDSFNMDRQAMLIQQELLRQAGIDVDENKLIMHRYAGTGRLYPEPSNDALQAVAYWFLDLRVKLSACNKYSLHALDTCFSRHWCVLCSKALQLGLSKVVSIYFKNRLLLRGLNGLKYTGIFLSFYIKRFISRSNRS